MEDAMEPCTHPRTVMHQTGDGAMVEFCPDCGRNISVGPIPETSLEDRELLERAARAAGMEPFKAWGKTFVNGSGLPPKVDWNPLEDDGDALRLAVKLNLDILQDPTFSRTNSVEVCANLEGVDTQPWASEVRAPDPYAATRRAIVRAAASMADK
jgi:hypothetical protein